jgi:hypothetical protein
MSGDFDFEPVRGLPGYLPAGETLLWQGAPDLRSTALRVFHIRKIAIYFALLAAWRLGQALAEGETLPRAAYGTLPLLGLGTAALAILSVLVWLVCRTTVYSITSRRVVMRIGVALPIHFNLPFMVIDKAALKLYGDATGNISLKLTDENRLAYLVLWPHARPWRLARSEPMLRFVPEAAKVAQILGQAVAAAMPDKVQTSVPAQRQVPVGGETASWPLAPASV